MDVNWLSRPFTSTRRDVPIGRDEAGNPIYRTGAGHTYTAKPAMNDETRARLRAVEDFDRTVAGGGFPAPENRQEDIGNPLGMFLDEAVDMVTTPRRAYEGEPLTYGDVGEFALEFGLAGAPMPAPKGALRSGGMRSGMTPAQAQAQEVLDLLKSGRGDEVTDDMLAAADDLYLFENYDLPMDEASRMARAREMGFDTEGTFYHGGLNDIDAFRINPGSKTDHGWYGEGVYGGDADTASIYAMNHPTINRPEGGNVVDAVTRGSMYEWPEGRAAALDQSDARTISKELTESGYSGANIYAPNDLDTWGDAAGSLRERVIYDPTNIRSRFARFDPRLSHLRNLSAGVAGGGVVLSEADRKQEIQNYLRSK